MNIQRIALLSVLVLAGTTLTVGARLATPSLTPSASAAVLERYAPWTAPDE